MQDRITMAENIRLIRENLGYSQEYIASQLGLTQQAYSSIEKHPENASLKRLKQLANVLQVKFVNLLGEEDVHILNNFHQEGGQAVGHQQIENLFQNSLELTDKFILSLKEEIEFLRKQLDKR